MGDKSPTAVLAEGASAPAEGRWAAPGAASIAVLLLAVALAVLKLAGPRDLMDNEQQRTAAYVLDALQNHHWIMQRDLAWEIASKPPMYVWLAAAVSRVFPRPTETSLLLPTILATILLAWIVCRAAMKFWGVEAALLAALAYLLSPATFKQMGMARGDGLNALAITCMALAGFRAWKRGRGWTWFWLAAAVATLTKGPAALALGSSGLLAIWWERRSADRPRICRNWWIGVPIYLVLTLGWFLLAIHWMGMDVYRKLIVQEFVGNSVPGAKHGQRFSQILAQPFMPPFFFISRFLPWSLLTIAQLWRIARQPAADAAERRFERFLFCWIVVDLVFFCIAPHQRPDLLFPLFPAAAILAGRELASLLARFTPNCARLSVALIAVVGVASAAAFVRFVAPRNPQAQATAAVYQFSQILDHNAGPNFPFTHVDDPYALAFYLNTMRPFYFGRTKWTSGYADNDLVARYDFEAAAGLLKGDAAAFVVVSHESELFKYLPRNGIYDLASVKVSVHAAHVLSNRPELKAYDRMVMGVGPLRVETRDLKWVFAAQSDFVFAGRGTATFHNNGTDPIEVRVRFDPETSLLVHQIPPGENWQVTR